MEEAPRKQKSALGFSSLFGKNGSTSSRKKSRPPAPLTLSNITLPHPRAPTPSGRRDEEDRSPTAHTHLIRDISPYRRYQFRPNQLRPPYSARSAYAAMLTPRQQEQIEMEDMLLWTQLPVSAPPHRRWEGQRVKLRRGSSARASIGGWEIELQEASIDGGRDHEGRRCGLDWPRESRDRYSPGETTFISLGSPTTTNPSSVLDAPGPTAPPPFDVPTPTRPSLVSAFSTETRPRCSTFTASETPPDSRSASFASHSSVVETPSIYLRRPSVPDSPDSTRTQGYQRRISQPPPRSRPLSQRNGSFPRPLPTPVFASNGSLSSDSHGSSWQGSSLDAEGRIAMCTFDSMSFSQVLSQSLAAAAGVEPIPILGAGAGYAEASSRESGALEEFEQAVSFPWSGIGSVGEGKSEAQGRRREDPLSKEDWRQLEDLAAEGTDEDRNLVASTSRVSEGSKSSKISRRRGVFVSPVDSTPETEVFRPIYDYHSTPQRCITHFDYSQSAVSSSDPDLLPPRDYRVPISPSSPSCSRHVAHPPRSPGIQPLHLLRLQVPRSPSIQSGFSQAPTSPSSTESTAERFQVPRQQGWKTGLKKLALIDGENQRQMISRKRSSSAPECREQRQQEVGAERQELPTPSTSTQTVASDLLVPHAAKPKPLSSSSELTALDLESSSTDFEHELRTEFQSAQVVNVVRSPVASLTICGGRERGEVRSMARASLLPLSKSTVSSARMARGFAETGGGEAVASQGYGEKSRIDEFSLLRGRNRVLEEEVSRLKEALGMAAGSSTESL